MLLDSVKPGKTCLPIICGWFSNAATKISFRIHDFKVKQLQESLASVSHQKQENSFKIALNICTTSTLVS